MLISRVVISPIKSLLCTNKVTETINVPDDLFFRLKANLEKHVQALSVLSRHTKNPKGLNEAANYICKVWEEDIKLKVESQTYKGPLGDPNEYKNLIASFGPENAPRIVLGAHYDSEFTSKTPGADDNASGISGIIEVSRLLKELNPKLTKRIDVVAYCTEERPYCAIDSNKSPEYMGSSAHARSLKENNIQVEGAIILEMIGYFSDERNSQEYPHKVLKLFYPTRGNFIAVIGNLENFSLVHKVKNHLKENCKVNIRSISIPASILPDISRSDHDSYYTYDLPALMITDTADFRNPNYHQLTDTPDTLNYERMAEVVKGVFKTIVAMST